MWKSFISKPIVNHLKPLVVLFAASFCMGSDATFGPEGLTRVYNEFNE